MQAALWSHAREPNGLTQRQRRRTLLARLQSFDRFAIDPIEKELLDHFPPGSSTGVDPPLTAREF